MACRLCLSDRVRERASAEPARVNDDSCAERRRRARLGRCLARRRIRRLPGPRRSSQRSHQQHHADRDNPQIPWQAGAHAPRRDHERGPDRMPPTGPHIVDRGTQRRVDDSPRGVAAYRSGQDAAPGRACPRRSHAQRTHEQRRTMFSSWSLPEIGCAVRPLRAAAASARERRSPALGSPRSGNPAAMRETDRHAIGQCLAKAAERAGPR